MLVLCAALSATSQFINDFARLARAAHTYANFIPLIPLLTSERTVP
jgi:hypothetical protein